MQRKHQKATNRIAPLVDLQTTSATSSLPPGRVGGNRRNILNPSNLQPSPRQRPQCALRTRPRRLGPGSSSRPQLDVQRVDTQLLDPSSHILGRQHGSVRRGLVTVGLDLHSSGHTAQRFLPGEIRDVDKCVVERGKDVRHAPDELSLPVAREFHEAFVSGRVLMAANSRRIQNGSGENKGRRRPRTTQNDRSEPGVELSPSFPAPRISLEHHTHTS